MTQNTLLIGVSYSDCKKKSLQRALNLFNASAKICQIANFVTQLLTAGHSVIHSTFQSFQDKGPQLRETKDLKKIN